MVARGIYCVRGYYCHHCSQVFPVIHSGNTEFTRCCGRHIDPDGLDDDLVECLTPGSKDPDDDVDY